MAQSTRKLSCCLVSTARLECASSINDGSNLGRHQRSILQRNIVRLVSRSNTGKCEAKQPADGVHVRPSIGLCKPVLLRRSKTPRPQRCRISRSPFNAHSRNSQVNKMGAISRYDDVGGRYVSMHYSVLVQRLSRFADITGQRYGRIQIQRMRIILRISRFDPNPLRINVFFRRVFHKRFKRLTRHEIIYDNVLIRKFICELHLRQALASAIGQRGPHAPARQLNRHLLSDKRARTLERHQLGFSANRIGQHALRFVRVINVHRMHDLLVVQNCSLF